MKSRVHRVRLVTCTQVLIGLLTVALPGAAAAVNPISVNLQGQVSNGLFGWTIDRIGDINDDGFDDFAVGAPGDVTNIGRTGSVHIFLGRDGFIPEQADLVIPGEVSGDEFGYAVAGAGDINKDGYDDFLIGAPGSDAAGINTGRVYLVLGANSPSKVLVKSWDGDCPAARFGSALAGNFDFNHDARLDFAAGAPEHNCTGQRAGQVKIFLGQSQDYAALGHTFHGDQANWALGYSLAAAGDWDGDGVDDVIAGAPQPHDSNTGQAVIWFGVEQQGLVPERLVLSGQTGGDQFGWDVAGIGDINGDSMDDVAVGAPGRGSDHGAVYVFRGRTTTSTTYNFRSVGQTGGRNLGWSLDGGLDFDGDGTPDFIVGEPGANTVAAGAGQARVWWGGSSLSSAGDLLLVPVPPIPSFEANDAFGYKVAFVGSVDGDSFTEIMVGAPAGDGDGGAVGYVNYVFDQDRVPVQLLAFHAAMSGSGFLLTWDLGDTDGLLGLRLESGSGEALHAGWLAPETRSWTGTAMSSADRFRLLALNRNGTEDLLGETRLADLITPGMRILGANPFREQLRLGVNLPWSATVEVWDVSGRRVRELDRTGPGELIWDGLDAYGRTVPPGVYFIRSDAAEAGPPLKVVRIF